MLVPTGSASESPEQAGPQPNGEDETGTLRQQASQDVDDCLAYYLAEGSEQAAIGFIHELQHAFEQIGRHPAVGSLRHAHELNLPDLRPWSLARYPNLVFYVERNDDIDVWRVLHGQRDIPAWMQSPESG